MNAKEAKEIVDVVLVDQFSKRSNPQWPFYVSAGYIECYEKAERILVDTLSDVAFVLSNFGGSIEITEGKDLLLNSPDTEYDLVGVINKALKQWEEENG